MRPRRLEAQEEGTHPVAEDTEDKVRRTLDEALDDLERDITLIEDLDRARRASNG